MASFPVIACQILHAGSFTVSKQSPRSQLLLTRGANYLHTGNSLEELDLPISASERWMGFLVWWRCFLSRTKLIFSRSSGEITPSSTCLSMMSSAGNTR